MSKHVLSLDIPWGGARFIGAAYADLENVGIASGLTVTSVNLRRHFGNGLPDLPLDHPEIAGFIADKAQHFVSERIVVGASEATGSFAPLSISVDVTDLGRLGRTAPAHQKPFIDLTSAEDPSQFMLRAGE